jgi:hypothetical protein
MDKMQITVQQAGRNHWAVTWPQGNRIEGKAFDDRERAMRFARKYAAELFLTVRVLEWPRDDEEPIYKPGTGNC